MERIDDKIYNKGCIVTEQNPFTQILDEERANLDWIMINGTSTALLRKRGKGNKNGIITFTFSMSLFRMNFITVVRALKLF